MAPRQAKRQFGSIRKLPSGRFQARYTGPDGHTYAARRENGQALTFQTRGDADGWLSLRRSEILRNDWLPPAAPRVVPLTVREFAEAWLSHRDLEDRPGSTTTSSCATTCSPPSAQRRCPRSPRPRCGRGTPHSVSAPGRRPARTPTRCCERS